MVDSHRPRTTRWWLLLGGLVALAAVVAVCLWLFAELRLTPRTSPDTGAKAPSPVASRSEPPPPEAAVEIAAPEVHDTAPYAALAPDEVLGNIECTLVGGLGAGGETAIVTLPTVAGARFSVIDGEGTVLWDDLPFKPHNYKLGRGNDGVLVVGLGDLRRGSETFRPMDSPEPLRIYVGEHVVYETAKAWEFAVARDGSSFAVHEPHGGGASRLAVRNLALGTERHFDLGTRMTPSNAYEVEYALDYTLDGREVTFMPAHADAQGIGHHSFYPVDEGKTRRVTVENSWSATLVSSAEGYFVDWPEDMQTEERGRVWEVAKRRFGAAGGTAEDVWRHRLHLDRFGGRMFVSDDGRWLGLNSHHFHVLNTDTGEVVFKYPQTASPLAQLERLTSVVGNNASVADLGSLVGIGFRGDSMRFSRVFGQSGCATPPGEEFDRKRYRQCVRDRRERGLYRAVVDVYDLNNLALDAQPVRRTQNYHHEGNCVAGDTPGRGLQDVDGELAYLSG